METIQQFKEDLWNGIFQHTRNTLRPTLIFTIIYLILIVALVVGVFFAFIDMDSLKKLVESSQSGAGFGEMQRRNEAIIQDMVSDIGKGKMAMFVLILYGIIFTIVAWFMNLMLISSEMVLINGSANIGEALKRSINKNFLKLLAFVILMAILFGILLTISMFLAMVNVALVIVAILFIMVILFRFAGAPGAIVHGNLGVSESMSFSWKNISFGGGGKLLIVMIVIGIILFMVNLINMGLGALLGGAGSIISLIVQLAISTYMYAFMYAGLSAAFYRYADVEIHEEEEGHLLDEVE